MRYTFIATLFFFALIHSGKAQTKINKKMVGTWQRVALKGNNPCAIDQRIVLNEDGSALIKYGYRFEECEPKENYFDTWSYDKQLVVIRGRNKKLVTTQVVIPP